VTKVISYVQVERPLNEIHSQNNELQQRVNLN